MDAQIQRSRDQRQARRLLDGGLKKVVDHQARRLTADHRGEALGTGGVTTVSGEQLEVALGGYSTWMSFEKIVSAR